MTVICELILLSPFRTMLHCKFVSKGTQVITTQRKYLLKPPVKRTLLLIIIVGQSMQWDATVVLQMIIVVTQFVLVSTCIFKILRPLVLSGRVLVLSMFIIPDHQLTLLVIHSLQHWD